MNLPSGKYDIIYADPPWQYDDRMISKTKATDHYQTMSHIELCEMQVEGIAEDNSLLFMWATSPNLDQSIKLGQVWGFKYKTVAFVWDKQSPVYGNYTLSQCEMCLVFKRGSIPKPRGKRNIKQFLSCRRSRHSDKPDQIRHGIMEMFPEQSKIELFARQRVPGWDCWGNEIYVEPTLF